MRAHPPTHTHKQLKAKTSDLEVLSSLIYSDTVITCNYIRHRTENKRDYWSEGLKNNKRWKLFLFPREYTRGKQELCNAFRTEY